jgi:hypothetical protein
MPSLSLSDFPPPLLLNIQPLLAVQLTSFVEAVLPRWRPMYAAEGRGRGRDERRRRTSCKARVVDSSIYLLRRTGVIQRHSCLFEANMMRTSQISGLIWAKHRCDSIFVCKPQFTR